VTSSEFWNIRGFVVNNSESNGRMLMHPLLGRVPDDRAGKRSR
jgi:hypothetical protein